MADRPLVGITMGDPAGIGAEIIVAGYPDLLAHADVLVIGDADVVRDATSILDADLDVRPVQEVSDSRSESNSIDVLNLDNVEEIEYGALREDYGRASLEYVEKAIDLALANRIDAIATAPINKQAIRMAGAEHAGHTGLLADRTDTEHYAMLLIEGPLRVSHVSTHVPLREAIELVTTDQVLETIRVTDEALRDLGIDDPRIAVAGLNPHAGEGGLLGDEDEERIAPAIDSAREEGIDAFGPEPSDTVFPHAANGEADSVVAMYHDQGHIPIKTLGFDSEGVSGVNATIGLSIVRTSVDHGTAFDIAGEGVASPTSLIDAVRIAAEMTESR